MTATGAGAGSGARLCIFARVPVPGRVKRRLAADLGDGPALTAYIALVEDTLQRLARVPGMISELWVDGDPDPVCTGWARRWRLPLRRQADGDLGVRMDAALRASLDVAGIALVVGTDCPTIDAAYVQAAVQSLDDHDVVLGPAADGGYGLVGVRRPVPELFRGVAWGTGSVLAATRAAAAAAGLRVALLPQLWDVDDISGWRRYLALRAAP